MCRRRLSTPPRTTPHILVYSATKWCCDYSISRYGGRCGGMGVVVVVTMPLVIVVVSGGVGDGGDGYRCSDSDGYPLS